MMNQLSDMPNIGKVVEELLVKTGIEDQEALKEIGSKEAFKRIKKLDETSCLNKLYALEGAIQGIRWHDLSTEKKAELKAYFNKIKDGEGK